jgi:hypothetical protein
MNYHNYFLIMQQGPVGMLALGIAFIEVSLDPAGFRI